MGFQPGEVLDEDLEGFIKYLRAATRVFVTVEGHEYYITHTDCYWRIQDCETLNDKGHFTDCSELVNTLCEIIELPWFNGRCLHDLYREAIVRVAVPQDESVAA